MDNSPEKSKSEHDANHRIFYPLFPFARFAGGLVLVGVLIAILMLLEANPSHGLLIGAFIALISLPQWLLIFRRLRRDYLILSDTGIAWRYENLEGATPWANLAALAQNPAGEFDNRYGIRLHQPVEMTAKGEPSRQTSDFIPLSRYARRTNADGYLSDFFFRRTLLGEALYRKAPQIFARLEEREKDMGFMTRSDSMPDTQVGS